MASLKTLSGINRFSAARPSKMLAEQKSRIKQALRDRLNAYHQDQMLGNLLRPPGTERSQFRFRWGKAFYDTPVRTNVVFYEAFAGSGALCNPYAIFEFLLNDPSKRHLKHVWSFKDNDDRARFNSKYSHFKNVKAVGYNTVQYWREVSTAKYLINNATFPAPFTKRSGQIYVNTWHGTPLKKMGYDSNEGAFGARNILRNFVQADYLLSPNPYSTRNMYLSAYKLEGLFQGKILEQGYPRIDAQFATDAEKAQTRNQLLDSGVRLGGKKFVLYAPTWKGSSFHRPVNEARQLVARMRHLEKALGEKYDFGLKVHQQVYQLAVELPELKKYIVPNEVPTNHVLALTDILITDYSSVFFDFLVSEKPIIFFTPDQAQYHEERGVYLEELPGPSVQQFDDLIQCLDGMDEGTETDVVESFRAKRSNAKTLYCNQEDGHSTERIVSIVFDGNPSGLSTLSGFPTDKRKILLYIGGMRNNGITSSALNLLNNIDYSKFDVSIWAPQPAKGSLKFLYDRIPAEVRQFLRQGTHPSTAERDKVTQEFLTDERFGWESIPSHAKDAFAAEWARNFGSSKFDFIIDYSGYAGFWSFVLLQGEANETRSVWLHNDLISDRDREIDGKKPNFDALSSQFKSYKYFDNLVSVSQDLMEINRSSLHLFAKPECFKASHNTVDVDKIVRAMQRSDPQGAERVSMELRDCADLTAAIDKLLEFEPADSIRKLLNEREVHKKIFTSEGSVRFVSAGRMSPEKNHARLLRAFALAHKERPDTELVLLGDGALRSELEDLASELGIRGSVRFAGMVDDALSIMKDCDCFVLSSDYEGQPMVILEASSVGIPVLTVAFATVRNSLGPERGVVVEKDDGSLAQGMVDFVDGKISRSVTFDYNSYNGHAMREFYEAIGATA